MIAKSPSNLTSEQEEQIALQKAEIARLEQELAQARIELSNLDSQIAATTDVTERQNLRDQRQALIEQINQSSANFAMFSSNINSLQQRTNALTIIEQARIGGPIGSNLFTQTILGAMVGGALAAGLAGELYQSVKRVQSELFVIGADLATPLEAEAKWITRTSGEMTAALEQEIDTWDAVLTPLKNFILPGGTMAAAFIHQARTVCRRAERWVAMLQETDPINPEALRYLNRLSDWLFIAAREANRQANQPETTWESPARRT